MSHFFILTRKINLPTESDMKVENTGIKSHRRNCEDSSCTKYSFVKKIVYCETQSIVGDSPTQGKHECIHSAKQG